jgi:hypothetical protein
VDLGCLPIKFYWQDHVKKRLTKPYEQLSKSKSGSYIIILQPMPCKKINFYVLQFGKWAKVIKLTIIKICVEINFIL